MEVFYFPKEQWPTAYQSLAKAFLDHRYCWMTADNKLMLAKVDNTRSDTNQARQLHHWDKIDIMKIAMKYMADDVYIVEKTVVHGLEVMQHAVMDLITDSTFMRRAIRGEIAVRGVNSIYRQKETLAGRWLREGQELDARFALFGGKLPKEMRAEYDQLLIDKEKRIDAMLARGSR